MSHITFAPANPAELSGAKANYLQRTVAPLDGMWQSFVEMGNHYSIERQSESIGYYVVNSDNHLLRFSLNERANSNAIFDQLLSDKKFASAVVSTAEPDFLTLCMDYQSSISVNAIMYQDQGRKLDGKPNFELDEFRLVQDIERNQAIEFAAQAMGANRDWLNGYYSQRIQREELYGLWIEGQLAAAGECRLSDSQKSIADLGMVVAKSQRGRGVATAILCRLRKHCNESGLTAICSTERDNVAAQKAITRAGFDSNHRILNVEF